MSQFYSPPSAAQTPTHATHHFGAAGDYTSTNQRPKGQTPRDYRAASPDEQRRIAADVLSKHRRQLSRLVKYMCCLAVAQDMAEDAWQAGAKGVLIALERYDWERESASTASPAARFWVYAAQWAKHEIQTCLDQRLFHVKRDRNPGALRAEEATSARTGRNYEHSRRLHVAFDEADVSANCDVESLAGESEAARRLLGFLRTLSEAEVNVLLRRPRAGRYQELFERARQAVRGNEEDQ